MSPFYGRHRLACDQPPKPYSLNKIQLVSGLLLATITGVVGFCAWQFSAADKKNKAVITLASNAMAIGSMPVSVDLFALIKQDLGSEPLYNLSTYDRNLYKQIFAAQEKRQWTTANALMRRLHNDTLVGHVLFNRYITSSDYKASYAELRDWMVKYGDQPDAYKVYQLAQKRRNNDPDTLPAPQIAKKLLGSLELAWFSNEVSKTEKKALKPAKRNNADVRQLMRNIKTYLAHDDITIAYKHLGKSKASAMLTKIEYDSLLGEIAAGYYYNGKYDQARSLADQATKRSGVSVPIAQWIGGLSAWQMSDYQSASRHFAAVTRSHSRNPWMLSAGAFWAARAHEKLGNKSDSREFLVQAASQPRTFYGLIARTRLGKNTRFSWDAPPLTPVLTDALEKTASGKRALALVAIGQNEMAEKELSQIHPNGNQSLEKALVAAAQHFNMPGLALRLGNAVNQPDGKLYDAALYPVVPWKGDTDAGVDPALINALIRQESRFDTGAQSRAGATGLMQLMPATAKFISKKPLSSGDLNKPEVNIALGQRYVRHLLDLDHVDGNLLYLAAAYNAGPGNLARWQQSIDAKNDPFLFIETIPISETRAFVERVMTNYWIYNERFAKETDTLQSMSQDEWPIYTPGAATEVSMIDRRRF